MQDRKPGFEFVGSVSYSPHILKIESQGLITPHVSMCGAMQPTQCTRWLPFCFAELCDLELQELVFTSAKPTSL
jgi:hypothetical protein